MMYTTHTKKIGILSVLGISLLLSWCSVTKILQSEDFASSTGTLVISWDQTESSGDQGESSTAGPITITTSTDIVVNVLSETGSVATGEVIVNNDTSIANTTETGSLGVSITTTQEEENTFKDKIRAMIEKRKSESKWAETLTEDDIQLMEDILKQIVDESGQK